MIIHMLDIRVTIKKDELRCKGYILNAKKMCIGSLWDVIQLKKPNRTKLNQITHKYLYKIYIYIYIYIKYIYIYIYIYILLTRISNVTFNPQLVLFDRLPFYRSQYYIEYIYTTIIFEIEYIIMII